MSVYSKVEETGDVFYIISFYEGNCIYFIRGQDNLEELKVLVERYWNCVKDNKKV